MLIRCRQVCRTLRSYKRKRRRRIARPVGRRKLVQADRVLVRAGAEPADVVPSALGGPDPRELNGGKAHVRKKVGIDEWPRGVLQLMRMRMCWGCVRMSHDVGEKCVDGSRQID